MTSPKSPQMKKQVSKSKSKQPHWYLSPNPDKAWAELFFLQYSVVWPLLFGLWAWSGLHLLVGDLGNMIATLLIASPNILFPLLYCPTNKPVVHLYWFKFLLWMMIFTFVATYFWTEYFFEVLGMKYNFPHLTWNFDSALLGSGKQRVPLMMLVHGWYFFITYHTCSIIFIRTIRNLSMMERLIPHPKLRSAVATVTSAWFFAWAEIRFTTMDAIKDQFEYANMPWALTWGASMYACYFLASFPLVQDMDEEVSTMWDLRRVVENSLAASMIGFILIDLFVQFGMPPLWKEGFTFEK